MSEATPELTVASAADLADHVESDPLARFRHEEGCALCGHAYAQKHRIRPGCWGGNYDPDNVIKLCPNHHAAIHLMMKWCYTSGPGLGSRLTDDEWVRLDAYRADRPLAVFFGHKVKPVVIERLVAEGRWHPYKRTLPPSKKRKKKRGC